MFFRLDKSHVVFYLIIGIYNVHLSVLSPLILYCFFSVFVFNSFLTEKLSAQGMSCLYSIEEPFCL